MKLRLTNAVSWIASSFDPSVLLLLVLALAILFGCCSAYAGPGGPDSYLGFKKYELPTVSRERVGGLEVIDAGRLKESNLPFVTLGGYVSPDGEKISVLTLLYTDEEFPRLIAVSATVGPLPFKNSERLLSPYAKVFNVEPKIDVTTGLPAVEKKYSDGTFFKIALIRVDFDHVAVARLVIWGNPQ